MYRLKLWPVLNYRLDTMATPFKVADMLLRELEYKMLLVLGVNRNIKHRAINMVVQHFGIPSILGQKFQALLECLQLEVGTNINLVRLEYRKCKHLVTDCWLTTLW